MREMHAPSIAFLEGISYFVEIQEEVWENSKFDAVHASSNDKYLESSHIK